MSLNLMTGYAGEPHITSADDGAVNAAIYGAEKYVLNTGKKFAYELISNNLIKIKDGYAMNQGRKIGQAVNDYEELTIDNGLQGVKRSDIIAIRYSKNIDTGIESAEFVVIKGTSGDTYKDPACETGNIIQGDSVDDFPLYRVKIDGLNISEVESLFNVLVPMNEMADMISSNKNAIDSLNSNLGTFDYDNKVSLQSGNFPYTVPKNGILSVIVTPNSGTACVLRINNGNIDLTTGSYGTTLSNHFLVNKGEQLSITASSNLNSYDIRFIPFKQ